MSEQASPNRIAEWLLIRGLPRDPQAAPHIMAMLVSAVATVLLVRGFWPPPGIRSLAAEACTSPTCCGVDCSWSRVWCCCCRSPGR